MSNNNTTTISTAAAAAVYFAAHPMWNATGLEVLEHNTGHVLAQVLVSMAIFVGSLLVIIGSRNPYVAARTTNILQLTLTSYFTAVFAVALNVNIVYILATDGPLDDEQTCTAYTMSLMTLKLCVLWLVVLQSRGYFQIIVQQKTLVKRKLMARCVRITLLNLVGYGIVLLLCFLNVMAVSVPTADGFTCTTNTYNDPSLSHNILSAIINNSYFVLLLWACLVMTLNFYRVWRHTHATLSRVADILSAAQSQQSRRTLAWMKRLFIFTTVSFVAINIIFLSAILNNYLKQTDESDRGTRVVVVVLAGCC